MSNDDYISPAAKTSIAQLEATLAAVEEERDSVYHEPAIVIPRSSLPALPEGWDIKQVKLFAGISDKTSPECERLGKIFSETTTMTAGEYQFLLTLLNAVYGGGEK